MRSLRSLLLTLTSTAFAASVLVACAGVSSAAGWIGGGVSLLGAVLVLIFTAGTQQACSSTCLSPPIDPDRRFCLSDVPMRQDAIEDAGTGDDGGAFCLSDTWSPDTGDAGDTALNDLRRDTIRRLASRGVLPGDVAQKLEDEV